MVAIPQYRAKKIDSDESVEGFFLPHEKANVIIVNHNARQMWAHRKSKTSYTNIDKLEYYEIDPSTLAIHFPDMIDSEGTKIFASLSEDGKGGDIVVRVYDSPFTDAKGNKRFSEWVATYESCRISFCSTVNSPSISYPYFESNKKYMKVTGIQE